LELTVGGGGTDAIVTQLGATGGRVFLGQRICAVGPLLSGAWHHLLCVADNDDVDASTCVLDGVIACAASDGEDPVGDGGNVDLTPGSAAVAAVRIMSGDGFADVDLEAEARARLHAWLGVEGDLAPSAPGDAPAFTVFDSAAFLVSPRWPRLVQRGTATGLLLEPATASLHGDMSCPEPRASRQGLAVCTVGAGATMTVDAAEGTLSLRILRGATENLAAAADVAVVEQGVPDRTIALSPSPWGFLRGTVPENATVLSAHRVGIRNVTNVPLLVVRPAITTGTRSTPTAVDGERVADDWFVDVPTGVARAAFDVTRLDAGRAVIGDVIAGDLVLRLQLRAEVAELIDIDSGDAVASGRLPAGSAVRIEVGQAAGTCGDTCVGLETAGPVEALFLGGPDQDRGSSDGVIVEAVDFFDR